MIIFFVNKTFKTYQKFKSLRKTIATKYFLRRNINKFWIMNYLMLRNEACLKLVV